MATAALVNSDIEIGRSIVAALTRASIPVTLYLWAFVPQIQEWQFIIATPLVDTKGPLAAYGEVNRALQKEGILDEIPTRRLFLKSPTDRVLRSLERQSRASAQEQFRVVNAPISGSFVEDVFVYTGSIHIVELHRGSPEGQPTFSLVYTPYAGAGGAAPSVRLKGNGQLRDFLRKRLHIDEDSVESTIRSLENEKKASIPHVELRPTELRTLGLA
jgi:hypothetical protein